MNTKDLKQIEEELYNLMQSEISDKKILVDAFVHKHPVEVGKILFTRVKEESFVQNPFFFPTIFQQVFPHIDDEFYIQTLIEIIKHKKIDPRIRLQTTRLLGWRKEEAKEAIPYLLPFKDGESALNQITAIALAEIGYEKFDELIPTLLVALEKGLTYITRMNAARLLKQDESYLPETLPHLIKAIEKDSDYRFRQKIARYFGEINNPDVKKALIKTQKSDKHPIVRSVASSSLKDLEKLG
ncbi:MAG: HEAT repeat domain-containing protein [Asgard group archaeon]|nr:HEAT repeat domain-containing protein [Asgard group archaeon]